MFDNIVLYRGVFPVLRSNVSILKRIVILIKYKFIPIHCGGYWSVPNSFLTKYKSDVYLFTRYGFDEELDDYPENYEVYIVKNISLENAFTKNLWYPYNYEEKIFLGEISTDDVIFDWSNKKFVNTIVFEMIK
jgi:hypothetical protein